MQLAQREPYVIDWAKDKGLIQHTTEQALAQHGKTDEEVGELLAAIERYESIIDPSTPQLDVTARVFTKEVLASTRKAQSVQVGNIRLEAGDVLVTLIIQCAIQKQSLGYAMAEWDRSRPLGKAAELKEDAAMILKAITMEDTAWAKFLCTKTALQVGQAVEPYDLTLEACLEAAWHKIRGRKGQTVDGVFIKESA